MSGDPKHDYAESALRRAQEWLEDIQAMTKVHEEVPQWGWPDYSQQMQTIRRVAGKASRDAKEALEILGDGE